MAGKISEYSSTRTAFAGLDLFDVSATDDAGSTYVSQKTTWTNIKAQLTSELSFLSAGDNVSALINDAGYVTSNITHTGEVTGLATLTAHPTMISNKTLVTAVATDMVLLWDATDSTLKKADVNDFLSGGGNTLYSADDTIGAGRIATLTDSLTFTGGSVGINTAALLTNISLRVHGILNQTVVSFRNSLGTSAYFTVKDDGQIIYDSPATDSQVNIGSALSAIVKLRVRSAATDTWIERLERSTGSVIFEAKEDGDVSINNASGTSVLYSDASASSIGIGTTTPSDKLQVVGALNVTGLYKANGTSGVASFTGGVTSITITNGIVTAIS